MATLALRPIDELAELQEWLGTKQTVANVLGKTRPQIARWLSTEPGIQGRNRRLINDCWSVARLLRSLGVSDPARLAHMLLGRRPELGYKPPAELIWKGETDELIAELKEVEIVPDDVSSIETEIDQISREQIESFSLEGFEPYDTEGAARAGLVGLVSTERPLPTAAPVKLCGLTVAEPLDW
jgi:hypothetical protein